MEKQDLLAIVASRMKARDFEPVSAADEEILDAVGAEPGEAWYVHDQQPMVAGLRLAVDGNADEFFIALVQGRKPITLAATVAPADTMESQGFSELVTALLRFWAQKYKTAGIPLKKQALAPRGSR
jgi:hypothetical protein